MYKSQVFKFINSTDGLKKGTTYVFLGGISSGKSTAARSVLFDMASRQKVFLFSTEETEAELRATYKNKFPENLVIFHEDTLMEETQDGKFIEDMPERLIQEFVNSKAEIFFIDNITTSYFYLQNDSNPSNQGKFASDLIRLSRKLNFPLFVIAHTKIGIRNNSMIGPEDIRGSKVLSMKTPFLYTFQRIQHKSDNQKKPISVSLLRILKARGTTSTYRTFNLFHDSESGLFDQDAEISIETFSSLVKEEVRW